MNKKQNISDTKSTMLTYKDVLLFVPNIIGYTRVLLTTIAVFCLYSELPHHTVIAYVISEFLDVADGYFARKFNQCSKFGEVLDMITDRCTTTCLITYLIIIYPQFSVFYCFLISMDISSHYMQMYDSLSSGSTNHKNMDSDAHPILKAYYTNRQILFWLCFGNEAFFILSYYVHYLSGFPRTLVYVLLAASFPVFLVKNLINLVQLFYASKRLAINDATQINQNQNKSKIV
ncbi:hypothetical protein BB560_007102 [Smittium megazygosporum]|uniref:CDP-diacylglycerol--inositol 3-phosphatidyltransferase n=1 Tax=Smittium megazygosporum TaxID=133381 RepID=A0A2T9XYT8_9FUNG|nr:hypothetical protein BB560_007102 [Smittium megazygosporum]